MAEGAIIGGPKKAFRFSRTRPLTAAAVFLTIFYYIIIFGRCKPEKRAKGVENLTILDRVSRSPVLTRLLGCDKLYLFTYASFYGVFFTVFWGFYKKLSGGLLIMGEWAYGKAATDSFLEALVRLDMGV